MCARQNFISNWNVVTLILFNVILTRIRFVNRLSFCPSYYGFITHQKKLNLSEGNILICFGILCCSTKSMLLDGAYCKYQRKTQTNVQLPPNTIKMTCNYLSFV